ncbi:RNA 2',3'-cyclic phosphodiesterase [candidate division NPL-UPA2 bacterium]|nr:RNA 2',3'-cyclic phosphodiesterase [candidate division NPL-UPA2 bacterium]
MEKIRSFIAVRLDSEIRSKLASVQDELKKCKADVKWVKAENIHITLKFLGYILESQLKDIFKAADESIEGTSPFTLSFSGLGVFPKLQNPRVVWMGVKEGKEELVRISRNLEEILNRCGFEKEERPFHPHLTLGRVKSPRNRDSLIKAIESEKDRSAGSMQVEELVVMQSLLKPGGAEYSALHVSRLREG